MKNKSTQLKNKGALAAATLVLAMASGFAQAALVTQWTYSTNAIFSDPSWTTGNGTTSASASELSWGSGAGDFQVPTNSTTNRSALTVGNFAATPETLTGGGPATGSVITDENGSLAAGEIGKGISLTHWNNVLDGSRATLTGAKITDTITLTPLLPLGGPAQAGPTLTFDFHFRETPNNGTGGLCADGLSATTVYGYSAAGGGCPDLFGYVNTQVVNQSFNYDGYTYFISVLFLNADGSLDTVGIPALGNGECTALGLANGCFGFKTLETQATTKRFGFAISARPLPVPEPGTLALMGLALLGLGATRYRKAS